MMILDSANLTPTVILELLCCGIFSLLYGVHLITDTIQQEMGPRLQYHLLRLTRKPYGAFSFGLLLAMATQSGGATSSLLVGLVNAQLLPLSIAIAALMGSNVGSAMALSLLALHLTRFAFIFVGFGLAMALLTQQTRRRGLGQICFGFGLIIFGLAILEAGSSAPTVNPMTIHILEMLAGSPFLLALGGMLLSMLFCSSIAGIGLIIVLASNRTLPIDAAIAFLLGANVGSTMIAFLTALLKGSTPGKRLALIHSGTKLIGATLLLGTLAMLTPPIHVLPLAPGILVAVAHLGFNVALALLFIPYAGWLATLAERLLPEQRLQPASDTLPITAPLSEVNLEDIHTGDLVDDQTHLPDAQTQYSSQ